MKIEPTVARIRTVKIAPIRLVGLSALLAAGGMERAQRQVFPPAASWRQARD